MILYRIYYPLSPVLTLFLSYGHRETKRSSSDALKPHGGRGILSPGTATRFSMLYHVALLTGKYLRVKTLAHEEPAVNDRGNAIVPRILEYHRHVRYTMPT